MTPAYTAKLGFTTWKTSVRAYKIDNLPLKIHNMTWLSFYSKIV